MFAAAKSSIRVCFGLTMKPATNTRFVRQANAIIQITLLERDPTHLIRQPPRHVASQRQRVLYRKVPGVGTKDAVQTVRRDVALRTKGVFVRLLWLLWW